MSPVRRTRFQIQQEIDNMLKKLVLLALLSFTALQLNAIDIPFPTCGSAENPCPGEGGGNN